TILDWYLDYASVSSLSKEEKNVKAMDNRFYLNKKIRSKKFKYVLGSFALLAVIIFSYLFVDFKNNEKSPSDKAELEKSIAVLPFRNLSNDESQAYFCDGFMEEVLNHLQRVKSFSVRSRTSSYIYKESPKTLPEIAKELNVNYIIEGSIAHQGNNLKIWVQLINTKTDEHLWSEDYNREMKQVFTIQSDIAKQIAQKLKTVLSIEEIKQIEKIPTENLEAYDYYLLGKASRLKKTEKDIHKAINLLEKAIEKDPLLANAYLELSGCYTNLPNYSSIRPSDAYEPAKEYALKALELDSSSSAFTRLGVIKYEYDFNFSRADFFYKKAIQLKPNNAEAYYYYADFLYQTGRSDEALKMDSITLILDPVNLGYSTIHGLRLAYGGKLDSAVSHLTRLSNLHPKSGLINWSLGSAYYLKGNYKQAIKELEKGMKLSGEAPLWMSFLGLVYSKAGNKNKVKDILNSFEQRSKNVYIPYSLRAMLYAELGDDQTALEYLKIAFKERELFLIYFRYLIKDAFLNLQSDPRYIELMDKVG
ncbi:MAG: tetratricopeptide repeat protein, partial [Bacteroidota bacterium]